jgi:catechol 2,3-dioxygenase-like lactoylglutathione lyase family enzyme
MLKQARAAATLPAQDLERAKKFYAEKLGLTPTREEPGPGGGPIYDFSDGTSFLVYQSSGKPSGTHTQLALEVDDVVAEVNDLKAHGVKFEDVDLGAVKTVDGILDAGGTKGAWFKDSEGNLIAIGTRVPVGARRS